MLKINLLMAQWHLMSKILSYVIYEINCWSNKFTTNSSSFSFCKFIGRGNVAHADNFVQWMAVTISVRHFQFWQIILWFTLNSLIPLERKKTAWNI